MLTAFFFFFLAGDWLTRSLKWKFFYIPSSALCFAFCHYGPWVIALSVRHRSSSVMVVSGTCFEKAFDPCNIRWNSVVPVKAPKETGTRQFEQDSVP